MDDLRAWAEAAKAMFDAAKSAIGLLPSGPKRDAAEAAVLEAEAAQARANALLAQHLGMKLCDCRFPPVPMTRPEGAEFPTCPECGRVDTFRKRLPPQGPGGGWMA